MASEAISQLSPTPAESLRVVIVDDEPLARAHLRKMIETMGVDVVGRGIKRPCRDPTGGG